MYVARLLSVHIVEQGVIPILEQDIIGIVEWGFICIVSPAIFPTFKYTKKKTTYHKHVCSTGPIR